MSTKILVVNTGSSSLKCSLFGMPEGLVLAVCDVERIGEEKSTLHFQSGGESAESPCRAGTHGEALEAVLRRLVEGNGLLLGNLEEIAAVGHRAVHGAEKISESVVVDEGVLEVIRENFPLAPLHNPPNLVGLEAAIERLPHAMQVAVFDTAFHESMPPRAFLYALPYELYEQHHVRRYGFHGTSHRHVAEVAARMLGMAPQECNLITLHLGNGCSATAVRGGRSVDTSMGMTPLEGLVMGTRCGDIDPSLPFVFSRNLDMSSDEIYDLLNRRSGLAGLSGVSNDMREVISAARDGNARAELALDVFCYRVVKYIGAYWAVLGRLDGVVFTAGIGENSPEIRARICGALEGIGLRLDERRNADTVGSAAVISAPDSRAAVLVVPTDEALKIAVDTYQVYLRTSDSPDPEAP